jgi:hypothetical protein
MCPARKDVLAALCRPLFGADAARLALLASRAGFQRLGARLDTERVELQLAALN